MVRRLREMMRVLCSWRRWIVGVGKSTVAPVVMVPLFDLDAVDV